VAIAAGTAAAATVGRSAAIVIRHQSVAEQFEGATGTLVTIRAIAQFPSDAEYMLTAATVDGILETEGRRSSNDDARFDADGHPVFAQREGLGATDAFSVEATTSFRAFEATTAGGRTQVANVSGTTLDRCEFPAGFHTQATMRPGEHVEGPLALPGADPIVTCRVNKAPLEFSEPAHTVTMDGATVVVLHLTGAGA
jgi:hypothetical protein